MQRRSLLCSALIATILFAGCDANSPYRGPDARIAVDDRNYATSLHDATKPIVLEFYADWCGPCREIEGVIASSSAEHPEFIFAKIDVDAAPQMASQFQVSSIPCLVFLQDGSEVGRSVGSIRKSEFEKLLSRYFPSGQ
jgi:thioredoxin 1